MAPSQSAVVVVLDYGSGNLRSAERAVATTGVDVVVTADLEQARTADGLVVPGVGAFAACMAGLDAVGGGALIAERVAEGRPTLAICVGHQILFSEGVEHGVQAAGVGIWPGVVEQLQSRRLPHMGWNTVQPAGGSSLFAGIEDERFYFVHSYGVRELAEAPGRRITWAEHENERFVAAVEEGSLWSTQFHPEKSGQAGTRLISNWVDTPVSAPNGWTVLFDLGGVVLTWEPARAYEQVLSPELVPHFMATIGFEEWNRGHDSGRRYAESEAELVARHPEHAETVLAYRRHFDRTLGTVTGTGAVIAELQQAGVGLNALTNWSAETFPVARKRFGLLRRFTDILVSGEELLAKPDPAIFTLALQRFGLSADRTVFVDDVPANVAAARSLGLTGLVFTDAEQLRAELVGLGLLEPRQPLARPVLHLTERTWWQQALTDGHYPWSSRRATYEAEGFVHASFAEQVPGTRQRYYGDLADADLVVLELDPDQLSVPVVVEDLGSGPFPHLYGPLPVAEVRSVGAYAG